MGSGARGSADLSKWVFDQIVCMGIMLQVGRSVCCFGRMKCLCFWRIADGVLGGNVSSGGKELRSGVVVPECMQ